MFELAFAAVAVVCCVGIPAALVLWSVVKRPMGKDATSQGKGVSPQIPRSTHRDQARKREL